MVIRKGIRGIYLSFYTLGFFITLILLIFFLINYSRSLTQPQLPTVTGWRVYNGQTINASLLYPSDWSAQEYDLLDGHGHIQFFSPDLKISEYAGTIEQGVIVNIRSTDQATTFSGNQGYISNEGDSFPEEISVDAQDTIIVDTIQSTRYFTNTSVLVNIPIAQDSYYIFSCEYVPSQRQNVIEVCFAFLESIELL